MNDTPAIVARNLSVGYGSRKVLRDVNLTVGPREFVAIVGPSGVGKSSLLHALAEFIPCEGSPAAPKHFGFVFQSNPVFPFLTVEGNVGLGVRNGSTEGREQRITRNIAAVGLEQERHRYPGQLSGGQVQRVALARALAADPEPRILYCDEPFGALDVFTRERMQELLLSLWESRSMAVLFVTHSIEEAIFLADRVILLKNNRLAEEFCIEFKRPRRRQLKFSSEFVSLQQTIVEAMESR
ncbi:MAG: ABC transporter ATP-binding protein [Planctomycetaceae bacterium]|nr:ABC transporter ATP-binding protein [Planctomycetaceae bacterium]